MPKGIMNSFQRHMKVKKVDCVLKKCLTCNKPYYSEGPYNRMCLECRRRA